ncbi:MAG: class I SAM-dependent methyltransferase [Ignavibacteria bacterium]
MSTLSEKILFPLSSRYDKDWIVKHSLGENVLYNLESLTDAIEIKPGMKILDLGCGKAISSIFLAKEFGASVWAVDPKICPTANFRRIKEIGAEGWVLPLRLNARQLPFPSHYFDIILAVDSFMYYGADFEFTEYISDFLKPGGQIGIVDICTSSMFTDLQTLRESETNQNELPYFAKSLKWWYDLWNTSDSLEVEVCEIVPANNFIKEEYVKEWILSGKEDAIAEELTEDSEGLINVFRMAARKVT